MYKRQGEDKLSQAQQLLLGTLTIGASDTVTGQFLTPYLDKIRFRPLADSRVWNSAVTNGIFIRFGDVAVSYTHLDVYKRQPKKGVLRH